MCVFYVIKNVILNVKRKFKYPGRGEVDSNDEEYREEDYNVPGISLGERVAMEQDYA